MNQKIDLDSKLGKELGFTSGKFNGGSYLWQVDNYIYISFIHSKEEGKGNLSCLFNAILAKGYGIKVPTPFAKMELICKAKGFQKTKEWFAACEEYADVWVKEGKA